LAPLGVVGGNLTKALSRRRFGFVRQSPDGEVRADPLACGALSSENTSVLPALARVVRGLSAIFWGLPCALLAAARLLLGEGPRVYLGPWGEIFGPWGRVWGETLGASCLALGATGLVAYGLRQLVNFQAQESIWIGSVNRASWAVTAVLGLLPFAHWWSRFPQEAFFVKGVALLFVAGVFFALALDHLLFRLAAMLPDKILRADARLLSQINRFLLLGLLVGATVSVSFQRWIASRPADWVLNPTGRWLPWVMAGQEQRSVWLLLGALIPLALTMTLAWKTKETIMVGVFRGG